MNKIYKSIGIGIFLSCGAIKVASADNYAQSGIVMGGSLGYAKLIPFSDIKRPVGETIKNGNFYGGVTLGYDYAFNSNISLGVESGFNYSKDIAKGTSPSFSLNMMNVPILGTMKVFIPYANGLNFFTKHGISWVRQSFSYDSNVGTEENKASSFNIFVSSIGVGWKINDFNIFTEYTHFYGKNWNKQNEAEEPSVMTFNSLTLGVTYTIPI